MRITLKGLQILIILATLILFAEVGYFVFYAQFNQYTAYTKSQHHLNLMQKLARLSASLAEERGLHAVQSSFMYADLGSENNLKEELENARCNTDKILSELENLPIDTLPQVLQSQWHQLFNTLTNALPQLRQQQDSAFDAYTRLILQLILFQERLKTYLATAAIQQTAQKYIYLLKTREYAGQERGLVMRHLLFNEPFDTEDFITLIGHIQQQQILLNNLLESDASAKALVQQFLHSPELNLFYRMRNQLTDLFDLHYYLNAILSQVGYVGLIHHYKDHIIHGDEQIHKKALKSYRRTLHFIQLLQEKINLSPQQRDALDILKKTFTQYAQNLERTDQLRAQGLSPAEINRRLKVDDQPAIDAIDLLSSPQPLIAPERWWNHATFRIQMLSNMMTQFIHQAQQQIAQRKQESLDQLIERGILLGLLLLLLILIAFYSIGRMNKLRLLVDALDRMVEQRHYHLLPVPGQDEVGQLSATFNALILERKQHIKDIWKQSNLDPLTELPNRTYLFNLLNHVLNDAKRNREKVGILFLDLDGFKAINDTEGHRVGDELLKTIAKRLKSLLRKNDILARIGGDEFIIVLPRMENSQQAITVAQKILQAITQPIALSRNKQVHISGSIGIALFPDDGTDADTLLMHADMAMYRAKETGKNRYACFDASWPQKLQREQQLIQTLTKAAENNAFAEIGFDVYYQPIVNLNTNQTSHVEALLRWHHPELGFISPAEFIPLAERSRLIIPLGDWVLETALRQAQSWDEQLPHPVGVAVNLSPVQARDHFARIQHLLDRLSTEGLDCTLLDLEVTESLLIQEDATLIQALESLRQRGCRLFLDDFGTGYSSLSYLKRYPFDVLKIDRSFINDLMDDAQDRELVHAILSLAEALSMQVVAEGVETAEQLDYLRQQGCHYAQGYYLASPMNAEACTQWLREHTQG